MSARRGAALRLPSLLAAACAVLAAIVVSEAMQPQADPSAAPSAESGKPALPPLPPDPEFAMPPEASFAAVVDRPVFSPGRRPIQGAGPAAAALGTSAEIRLIGVIISDDERVALVRLQNGDRLERLRQGEDLAGWSAVSIAPDRVVFRHGAVEEEIILDYKAPAPPAPPRPPRLKRKVAAVPPPPAPGPAMPANEPPPAPDGQPATPPEPTAQ